MRVAIIGAGIIGVTTAYELNEDGHEVTVFERCGSVAAETSFANAGVVAPGYVTPWAAPGMPRKVLSHLFSKHAPVRINASLDFSTLRWMWRWWKACRSRTYLANGTRMHRLAHYSRERLHAITATLKLEYERNDGYLVLLRTPQDLTLARPGIKMLETLGTRFSLIDAAHCQRVEPGLNRETALHAGIYLPDGEVGNCRQFAHLLRDETHRRGVQFRFHSKVTTLHAGQHPSLIYEHAPPEDSTIVAANSQVQSDGPMTQPMPFEPTSESFDAIVVCAALGAPALLRPLGMRIPMAPVYGYSITAPLRHFEAHPDAGPRSAVMDERYKVAISRLGQRVRVAGSAEVGGHAGTMNKAAIETLYKALDDWFPGVINLAHTQQWKGARPMMPDGPPIVGKCAAPGIWLNLGHGSSGWALSCGSARVLADALVGQPSRIDTEGLGMERLR